jgi:Peptidoglycan-synthase activator LpoB
MNADERRSEEMMNTLFSHLRSSAFICGLILLLSGCTSAVQSGSNTALSGMDLVQMTDDMAMQIAGDPQVQAAIAKEGRLKVVINPVENRMRAEVLPQGQAEAFVVRVRTLLSRHAPDKFTWIMNRDMFYRLRDRELEGVDLGPAPDAVSPDYSLSAVFSSLADENAKRRSSYYVCRYELTDLRDRTVLWSGSYEVKKIAVKGFLD